jgi:hypothetical protein
VPYGGFTCLHNGLLTGGDFFSRLSGYADHPAQGYVFKHGVLRGYKLAMRPSYW